MSNLDNRYVVKSVVHAAEVLRAFHSPRELLTLGEVVERTGFTKGMCFRLLYTLRECGAVEKPTATGYRCDHHFFLKRKWRIGFAAQGQDTSFSREVTQSLRRAADQATGLELLVYNNRYNPNSAIRNADRIVREHAQIAIEFQTDKKVAALISSKYERAGIPLIAVDIPHPNATYFGADNLEAGLIAGHHLARWTKVHWQGRAAELILLGIERAGHVPQMRLQGVETGLREILPQLSEIRTVRIDGDGQFQTSLLAVRAHLRCSAANRVLIAAANDPSALGAIRAFEEAGRASDCAAVGQNGEFEARRALREHRTRFVGTVAYFPENYGSGIMQIARNILLGLSVPPATFTRHKLLTPETVDRYYANDALTN